MRKVRSDAKLKNLPEEDQQELFTLMRGGMGYDQAKLWVNEHCGFKPSDGALNSFWKFWSRRFNENRMLKAVTAANDIQKSAASNLPLVSKATLTALTQAAFEAALRDDAESSTAFFNLVLKSNAQQLKRDSIDLARDKFEFDAAKAALAQAELLKGIATDAALDEDARINRARMALFGVLPEGDNNG